MPSLLSSSGRLCKMSLVCLSQRANVICRAASTGSRQGPILSAGERNASNGFQTTRRTAFFTLSCSLLTSFGQEAAFSDTLDEQQTPSPAQQVFLDISVDRKPFGKVGIEVYDDVRIGGQRFVDLAVGKEGVRYQATKFIRLTDSYVVNEGVRSLSINLTADSPIAGGDSLQELLKELDERRHVHDTSGIVSLVIKSNDIRPPKKKLVAVRGKFETVEEGGGLGPNGTGFVITAAPAPQLDDTHLVVGRVISGQDVVNRLLTLPTVKDNSGSVFFKAAKQLGDVRADVAEISFGKPFNRITVSSSGLFM